MGIDYMTCDGCGKAFADCSPYEYCSECDNVFCESCMNNYLVGDDEDYDCDHKTCNYCNGTHVQDSTLLSYCLKLLNTTKDEIVYKYLNQDK